MSDSYHASDSSSSQNDQVLPEQQSEDGYSSEYPPYDTFRSPDEYVW